jgi:superfamily II DNA or RNA helicase
MQTEEINIQKEAIQDECVERFKENNFYGISLIGTGGGKTKMMLKCLSELIERDKLNKILYTCNSLDLRDTDFPNEVRKWGYEQYLDKMNRLCYQSAYKLKGEYYDLLLGDEFDFALTPEYIKLLLNNTFKYIILVSATLGDEKLRILNSIKPKIPIVYKKKLSELESEGVLNKSKYHYVNYLLNEEENRKYLEFNRVIANTIKENESSDRLKERLKFVLQQRKLFLNKLKSSTAICKLLLKEIQGRTLIFSELTDQIDKITPFTYHGKNEEAENLTKFNDKEIDTLGVVGKIDRGVNLIGVENIILESCSSSQTKIVQKLGRGKRLEVNEFLNVYLLVPYYKESVLSGKVWLPKHLQEYRDKFAPTIVKKWLENALRDFNIPKELISIYKFNQ